MKKVRSEKRGEQGRRSSVFTKDEAKALGLKVHLRTRDGGHINPLAIDSDNAGMMGIIPAARAAASAALSTMQAALKHSEPTIRIEAAKVIFDGVNSIATIERIAHQMNSENNDELSASPNPLNFDRGGIGPDIALDLGVTDRDREKLSSLVKR